MFSHMTSPVIENNVCTVHVCHFTHFLVKFSVAPLGTPGARGPDSLNRQNPQFLRHWTCVVIGRMTAFALYACDAAS